MHISMFIEFNSLITVVVILALTFALYIRERSVLVRIIKATKVSHYLSFIVAMVWLIYWLSHIEELKQVGPILAFAFQVILYSSIVRFVVVAIKQLKPESKIS
ncbi:hypothetical protein [Photobacterium minamisatsumaniensis]|uniref:hypothetical protein n=1 Tax=Photobacterium minamisatsumaniensis TaxID=2910233 RepID=UPI003D109720